MYDNPVYLPVADQGIVIEFGDDICIEINQRVQKMCAYIQDKNVDVITEMIPSYRSLLVQFETTLIDYDEFLNFLKRMEVESRVVKLPEPKLFEIPVLYGGDDAPDLVFVAEHNNLTVEEVIDIHTRKEYYIYMLGFAPGFPYLGGMDKRISTPRLKEPRTKIRKGAVGIAGDQTGIYSIDSPGGWQLIGKTYVDLFYIDENQELCTYFQPGNYLKFVSINYEEFEEKCKCQ